MEGHKYVVRNNEIRNYVIDILKDYRLPFKLYIQPIYPEKSPNQLAYLFGVVCKRISHYTGHTPKEVYEAYKEHFRVEYSPDKNGDWNLRLKGASEFNTIEAEDFALMIRADAVIDMGINIELPNEVFVSELDYAEYDKITEEIGRSQNPIRIKLPKLSFRVRTYQK
jgi:hypothetical protein